MRAATSPDAYAAVFADVAARRKDLEGRQGALSGGGEVLAGMLRRVMGDVDGH